MLDLLKKPTGVFFVTAAFVLAGIFSARTLSTSMYPQIQKPTLNLWVPFRGVTSSELFSLYERDLQESLKKIESATHTQAEYNSGGINARIHFDFNHDREQAKQETAQALESFKAKLPIRAQRSMWLGYYDNGQGIFVAGISSTDEKRSFKEIYKTAKPAIEEPISELKEVDTGNNSGISDFDRQEIVIEFNEMNLVRYGLFLPEVLKSLQIKNGHIASGKITSDSKAKLIRTVNRRQSLSDIEEIIIAVKSSGATHRVVRLKDVASIQRKPIPPQTIWRVNNRPSLMVFASAKPGSNLLSMAEGVKGVIENAQKTLLPSDFFYEVFLDPAKYIRDAVSNMVQSAVLGTLIATLIILLFFGQFRSTLLIAISIPTTILTSFLFMKVFDVNINMISLGGMALAVGMIVDSSIVVLENIYRQIELQKPRTLTERLSVIAGACAEVRQPVIVSTLTSIIVFLPLSQTAAMAHAILGDMSKVVVFALLTSIAVALVFLPTLTRFFAGDQRKSMRASQIWNSKLQWLADSFYRRWIMTGSQSRRRASAICLGVFAVLTASTLLLVGSIKKEIIAEPDPSIFNIQLNAKFIQDREKVFEAIQPIEKALIAEKYKERAHIVSRARRPGSAQIFVIAKKGADTDRLQSDLEQDFPSNTDFEIKINSWNPTSLPLPEVNDILVEIRPDEPHLYQDAIALCQKISNAIDREKAKTWCNPWMSSPEEIILQPDESKLSHLMKKTGRRISPDDLARLVKVATQEEYLGEMRLQKKRLNVYARYPEKEVSSLESVKNLLFGLGNDESGKPQIYNLSTLASLRVGHGEPNVIQKNKKATVTLQGKFRGDQDIDQNDFQEKLRPLLAQVKTENPELGATASLKNPYADVDQSVNSLVTATLISVLLILTLLVVQFQSIQQALIVMAAIPLGVFGVMMSLFVFQSTISLNSMLGIILLAGIAVNNSILIMDFYNKIRATSDLSVREAVVRAVSIRFRPILMTMLTTILAMLPIALNFGTGGKTLQPLGIAISGGLLSSTILTLLVVPLLIFIFEKRNETCPQPQ